MYFRIIVRNKADNSFVMRTSKIQTATAAMNIHASLAAGFNGFKQQVGEDGDYNIEILQVTGLPQGAIISHTTLVNSAASSADNDD